MRLHGQGRRHHRVGLRSRPRRGTAVRVGGRQGCHERRGPRPRAGGGQGGRSRRRHLARARRGRARRGRHRTPGRAKRSNAFGRIDVMWANAGIPEPGFGMKGFIDSELDDWNNIFRVNATGIYLAWKHAAKWMVTNKRPGQPARHDVGIGVRRLSGLSDVHRIEGGCERAGALCRNGTRQVRDSRQRAVSRRTACRSTSRCRRRPTCSGSPTRRCHRGIPTNRAMPLRLDRPPVIRDNAYLALFLASEESAYMSGPDHPVRRRWTVRPHVDRLSDRYSGRVTTSPPEQSPTSCATRSLGEFGGRGAPSI